MALAGLGTLLCLLECHPHPSQCLLSVALAHFGAGRSLTTRLVGAANRHVVSVVTASPPAVAGNRAGPGTDPGRASLGGELVPLPGVLPVLLREEWEVEGLLLEDGLVDVPALGVRSKT